MLTLPLSPVLPVRLVVGGSLQVPVSGGPIPVLVCSQSVWVRMQAGCSLQRWKEPQDCMAQGQMLQVVLQVGKFKKFMKIGTAYISYVLMRVFVARVIQRLQEGSPLSPTCCHGLNLNL